MLYIKEQVYDKFKNNDNYKPILDFLMAKDYLNDDNIPLPTFKEMGAELGVKMYHLRKNIKDLYDEIFSNENGVKFEFKEIEMYFFLKYFESYQSFIFRNLGYLPRVGEELELPFVNAGVNTSYFYVDSITHCLQEGKQMIYIYLKSGSFNSYWRYRRDEAEMKREFSFDDIIKLDDYELKKKLGLG